MRDDHLPYRPELLKRSTNIIFHVNTYWEKRPFYKHDKVSTIFTFQHWPTEPTLIGLRSTGDRFFGRDSENLSDKGSRWGNSVSNEKCDVVNKKSNKTLKTNLKIRTPNIPDTPLAYITQVAPQPKNW